jgi:hypothetical protein
MKTTSPANADLGRRISSVSKAELRSFEYESRPLMPDDWQVNATEIDDLISYLMSASSGDKHKPDTNDEDDPGEYGESIRGVRQFCSGYWRSSFHCMRKRPSAHSNSLPLSEILGASGP